MNQGIFETDLDFYMRKRRNVALKKRIEIGGKIFCFHDYTFLSGYFCSYTWICVKCGKQITKDTFPIEYIPKHF